MTRRIYFVSDRTGLTAETLGHSLLTQFQDIAFDEVTLPYIDTEMKAREAVEQINKYSRTKGIKPIVFCTIIEAKIRDIITTSEGFILDYFSTFLGPLEKELGTKSSHRVGLAHSMANYEQYKVRIDAVNYALNNDDGMNVKHYGHADVIVIGVSRSGKTPTCLYLALQFGIRAANYPLTEDDLQDFHLPKFLQPHSNKLFGLTIDASKLRTIRTERRGDSRYASSKQCEWEVRQAEDLYKKEQIPFLSTTDRSIEEIATKILDEKGLKRHSY